MASPSSRSMRYLGESPHSNLMNKTVGFRYGLSDVQFYKQSSLDQLPQSINIANIAEESKEVSLKHHKFSLSSTDKLGEALSTKRIKETSESRYSISTLSKPFSVASPVQTSGDRRIFKVKKADSRKKLKPLSVVEDFVYKKRLDIGNEEYKVAMIFNQQTLIIQATHVITSEKFDLKLNSQEVEKIIGGKLNYETLAQLLLIDQGRLILKNSKPLQHRRLDDVSLVKRRVRGERDIVGGYILNYSSTESDPYQPIEETQDQPRVKEFVFYSMGRDEDLWKLVRSRTEFRGNSYSPSKKSIKIRAISASSSSSNLQRPVNNDQTRATRNEYNEYMSQSTSMSSNSRHISFAESVSSECVHVLQV